MERRDPNEWIKENRDMVKQYKKDNKEEISLFKKQYIEKNKDTNKNFNFVDTVLRNKWMRYVVKLYIYRKFNEDTIKQSVKDSQKKSREIHKDKQNEARKETMVCECGATFQKNSKSKHIKSKIHNRKKDCIAGGALLE